MNLRILKKLSKRAATYLPKLGDTREQFPSERGDNYHGWLITVGNTGSVDVCAQIMNPAMNTDAAKRRKFCVTLEQGGRSSCAHRRTHARARRW